MDDTDKALAEEEWVSAPEAAPAGPWRDDAPVRAFSQARFGRAAKLVGPVVAALLVGGGTVFAVDHSGSSAGAGNAASAFPGESAGGPAGSGGFGGGPGGVAGEQRIQGTVTAKTATSVTVKSSSGTASYTVNATTEIVRNGQAATLVDVEVGDPVQIHLTPSSSGQMLVERLLAGSSASGSDLGLPPGSGTSGGPAA